MVSSFLKCLLFVTLLCLLAVEVSMQQMCSHAHFNKTLDLTFYVRKNQTCHYVIDWELKNTSPSLPDNMKIDIKSEISKYGGLQTFHLKGRLTVPPPKPTGYEYFPGIGYYKFYTDGVTSFNEASKICAEDGAHLAILNSEAESNVMKEIYARHPKAIDWAYMGFHDMDVEGKFVTIFGDPLSTTGFNTWYPGQPDGGRGANCGSIHKSGRLNDLPCDKTSPWPFFCEYDLSWGDYSRCDVVEPFHNLEINFAVFH